MDARRLLHSLARLPTTNAAGDVVNLLAKGIYVALRGCMSAEM